MTTIAKRADQLLSRYGLLSGNFRPRALFNRQAQIERGQIVQTRVAFTGTSVANMKPNEMYADLARLAGGFAGAINKAGTVNNYSGVSSSRGCTGLTWTDTGTITASSGNDTAVWHGSTWTMSNGSTRSVGVGGVSATFDHAEVIFIGGTGTISVAVGGTTVGSIDTSTVAAGAIGFYAVPGITRAKQSLVLTATGTPKLVGDLGAALWDSTVSGLVVMGMAAPGLTYSTLTAQAWANVTAYFARYLPDLTTWEAKGGQWSDGTDATQLTALMDAVRAGAPNTDLILIGSTPDNGGSVPGGGSGVNQLDCNQLAERSAAAYAKAHDFNVASWDGYSPLVSWAAVSAMDALIVANGETAGQWTGDGIHLGWRAQAYLTAHLWRDMNLARFFRGKTGDTTLIADTQVNVGKSPGTPDLALLADTSLSLDPVLSARRALKLTPFGTTTPVGQIDFLGRTGQTWLTADLRLGAASGPKIGPATTAITLNAVSGTLAIDLTSAGIGPALVTVNLTGNVTSWTNFTNATGGAGQVVTIQFVQDATGGRTLAAPVGALRMRTGFAISTTANAVTTVQLMAIGNGGWRQISQEVSVAS
jgi:hypothetical protein